MPGLDPLYIGNHCLAVPLALAPMAGVTDRPFRDLCRRYGAGYAVGEMVASDTRLWGSTKSATRLPERDEAGLKVVQIVGHDPQMLANAAREHERLGADIIDINMGCPAKKVCHRLAGSALLQDPFLVEEILQAVVRAVQIPVTLKTRTGWSPMLRNGVQIAEIAENCGIAMLTVHGRTRADKFEGNAEYDTIAEIKQRVSIPVIANGDIDSAIKAREVLAHTNADGIMIGRSAHGRPWLFREIRHFLEQGSLAPPLGLATTRDTILEHLESLYAYYGETNGIRFARKHIVWYSNWLTGGDQLKTTFNKLACAQDQIACVQRFFERLIEGEVRAA